MPGRYVGREVQAQGQQGADGRLLMDDEDNMNDDYSTGDLLFEVWTPLGFCVRVTFSYWELITTIKHPVMAAREWGVKGYEYGPSESILRPGRQYAHRLV